ncbi:M23 family metallopeptidase [Cellulomonas sp. URHD0024]|uniref:M23 family metallopeptidase n=1 Tax=Cellulomonas sp. URHD0024 TaxID=1302620 RepID=UPI0009DC2BAA|nr:M23 family metallopeptidase [Cellulomonas sp. URHD0024]
MAGAPQRPTQPRRLTLAVGFAVCALVLLVVFGVLGSAVPASSERAAVGAASTYGLPLGGTPDVARRFEAPEHLWSAGHRGVDLRSVAGAPVLAPGGGVVTFAGSVAGRGVVTVAHPDGRRSSVEPVSPSVGVGTSVVLGQPVGTLESSGSHCAPQACLHWGVRLEGSYVDPLGLLPGAGPVVLLS